MQFKLKNWDFNDAQSISGYANNKKIADNLRNAFPYPYTLADAISYIHGVGKDTPGRICRAITVDGIAAGSIGVFVRDDVYSKSAEIGYWLGEPFWNKGIISRAIVQICAQAFERLPIVRIYAEPFAHNTGSRRALENAGFTLEGILKNSIYKNNRIYDSCIYALLKEDKPL